MRFLCKIPSFFREKYPSACKSTQNFTYLQIFSQQKIGTAIAIPIFLLGLVSPL